MHSTQSRKSHIHGALLGAAIGEALGFARDSLPRRTALQMYGRPPLCFQFVPNKGVYGEQTRLTLLNAQALLESRSDLRSLRRAFARRLRWYPLGLPSGAFKSTLGSASRSWLALLGVKTGSNATDSAAGARAVFSAVAMNGTGHRITKWVEGSTKFTHTHPHVIDGCRILASLADSGASQPPDEFNAQATLQAAINESTEEELREKLQRLPEFLEDGRSPSAVARDFGWPTHINEHILPITVMSSYCWLRYPHRFRSSVQSAICLGGATASLGAIVGSLAGAHLGTSKISRKLRSQLGGSPHDSKWIEKLADRFSHWPHGADDLHGAPAQSSAPLMQLMRNVSTLPISTLHFAYRMPYKHSPRRIPRRMR